MQNQCPSSDKFGIVRGPWLPPKVSPLDVALRRRCCFTVSQSIGKQEESGVDVVMVVVVANHRTAWARRGPPVPPGPSCRSSTRPTSSSSPPPSRQRRSSDQLPRSELAHRRHHPPDRDAHPPPAHALLGRVPAAQTAAESSGGHPRKVRPLTQTHFDKKIILLDVCWTFLCFRKKQLTTIHLSVEMGHRRVKNYGKMSGRSYILGQAAQAFQVGGHLCFHLLPVKDCVTADSIVLHNRSCLSGALMTSFRVFRPLAPGGPFAGESLATHGGSFRVAFCHSNKQDILTPTKHLTVNAFLTRTKSL